METLKSTAHKPKSNALHLSEEIILSASVACAVTDSLSASALASPESEPQLQYEVNSIIEKLPLVPDDISLKVMHHRTNVIVFETEFAILFVFHLRSASREMAQIILGSSVPLTYPYIYRYGGARVHLPFWKRANEQIKFGNEMYGVAKERKKPIIFCGHSVAGSIAHLIFAEMLFQFHPLMKKIRRPLQDLDSEAKRQNRSARLGFGKHMSTNAYPASLTDVISKKKDTSEDFSIYCAAYGSPFMGSIELHDFYELLNVSKHVTTFVNGSDCIPSILNVAQSATMLCKTSERFLAVARITQALLQFMTGPMQQLAWMEQGSSEEGGSTLISSIAGYYMRMSFGLLKATFIKLRENSVIAEVDFQYSPCGVYIFLKQDRHDFQIYESPAVVAKLLEEENSDEAFTVDCLLQHMMSAYLENMCKRTKVVRVHPTMNYYERLRLPRNATSRQIRTAYRSLALKWHPDRWSFAGARAKDRMNAEEAFKLLAEAYEALSDPSTREEYDKHLQQPDSIKNEFMRFGTVRGVTLEKAFDMFRTVLERAKFASNKVQMRFSSSTPSMVGQRVASTRRAARIYSKGLHVDNHSNMFAPKRVRISRSVNVNGRTTDRVMYVQPSEIHPGDVAAPVKLKGGRTAGIRTISVVGGAVLVGAGVALAVSAWSHYSDHFKRQKQAQAVRQMPAEILAYMLQDLNDQESRKCSLELAKHRSNNGIEEDLARKAQGTRHGSSDTGNMEAQILLKRRMDADNKLFEEFYDCATELEAAETEAAAEEEYFDCVAVADAVNFFFDDTASKTTISSQTGESERHIPSGASVCTPFGLGRIQLWHRKGVAAISYSKASCIGFVQANCLSHGAKELEKTKRAQVEKKREQMAELVIQRHNLNPVHDNKQIVRCFAGAGKEGALDSGIRALGGIFLVKGMARTVPQLGSSIAAPLAVASILVDIGKEYHDYRQKQSERKQLGLLSNTTEQLHMREFRLRSGLHVVSGAAAAAGAGIGAYGMVSSIGLYTGLGLLGPVGAAAATGAAIVGGMLGYFAGSEAYSRYTSQYFDDHQAAKEKIDRLELGARVMFSECDPTESGKIKKEDCARIMLKLHELSKSVPEKQLNEVVAEIEILQGEESEFVTWDCFWTWVSTEAARSLQRLEERNEDSNADEDTRQGSWWESYAKSFSFHNRMAESNAATDSVLALVQGGEKTSQQPAAYIQCAQIESLVNGGILTEADGYEVLQQLQSQVPGMREAAQKTLLALCEAYARELDECNGNESRMATITDGFGNVSERISTDCTISQTDRKNVNRSDVFDTNPKEQVNVLCSLLSTEGLYNFLKNQGIEIPDGLSVKHQDLHQLALAAVTETAEAFRLETESQSDQ